MSKQFLYCCACGRECTAHHWAHASHPGKAWCTECWQKKPAWPTGVRILEDCEPSIQSVMLERNAYIARCHALWNALNAIHNEAVRLPDYEGSELQKKVIAALDFKSHPPIDASS